MARIHHAPFALTNDGTLLVNLTPELTTEQLGRVLELPGVFVGLPLSADEARGLLARVGDAGAEAASRIVAARCKKARRGNGRKR